MNVQMIPLAKLVEPKVGADERTHSKENVRRTADSIKQTGLLHPIGVRPVPDSDLFEIMYGVNRKRAVALLGWPEIEAKVYEGFDDDAAELARIAENIHRDPLKKAQYLAAIRRWAELLMEKHPDLVGRKASGKAAAKAKARKKADAEPEPAAGACKEHGDPYTDGDPPADAAEPAAEQAAGEPDSIPGMLAEAIGRPKASVKRDLRIAQAFTDEQLHVLDALATTTADLLKLAQVKDDESRAKAVNLVAAGMPVDDAVAKALEAEPPAAKPDAALTDQEWLEKYCQPLRARLKDTTAFDRSAVLYRKVRDARSAFASKVKGTVDLFYAAGGPVGGFARMLNQVVHVSHPQHWLVCDRCKGTGEISQHLGSGAHNVCPGCKGDGFKVKVEGR